MIQLKWLGNPTLSPLYMILPLWFLAFWFDVKFTELWKLNSSSKGTLFLWEAFWFDVEFTELSGNEFVLNGHVVLVGDELTKWAK